MSQAKVYSVGAARKDQGKCGNCSTPILVGMPYRHFTVGFRSRNKQVRCMKSSCTPTRAQRESSRLSEIYEVIDAASFDDCETAEDIRGVLDEVAQAARDLAQEYADASVNPNTGAVFNADAEERGQNLEAYADELDSWDEPGDEPEKPEDENDEIAMAEYEEKYGEWLQEAKDSAQDVLDGGDF